MDKGIAPFTKGQSAISPDHVISHLTWAKFCIVSSPHTTVETT